MVEASALVMLILIAITCGLAIVVRRAGLLFPWSSGLEGVS